MKKNILSLIALVAITVGFTSCDQDAEGPKFDGSLNSSLGFETESMVGFVEPGAQEITVGVYRLNADGDITVPIVVDGALPEGVSVDPSVTFADGEKESSFKVKVADTSKLEADRLYPIAIKFPLANALPSETGQLSLTLRVKPNFVDYGYAGVYCWLFEDEWDVEIQKDINANIFKVKDFIADDYDFEFMCNRDLTEVDFETQPTGYVHSSYGMISINLVANEYVQFIPTNDEGQTINLLAIATKYTVSAGSFGSDWDEFYLEHNPLEK